MTAGAAAAGTRAFRLFAAAVLAAAVAMAAAVAIVEPWQPDRRGLVALVLLVAGFAVFRAIALEVDLRRDSLRMTLTEVPIVLGLALQPGTVVVLAFAVVTAAVGVRRRNTPAKFALNIAITVNSVAPAALLAAVLQRWLPPAAEWLSLLVGVAAGHGLGTLTACGGLLLLPGTRRPAATARLCLNSYVMGMLTAAATVGALEVTRHVPAGAALTAILAGVLAVIYRGYYLLLREQRDLVVVNQVSSEVAGAGRAVDSAAPDAPGSASTDVDLALELSRDGLNATRVVLHRVEADGGVRTTAAGRQSPSAPAVDEVQAVLATTPLTAVVRVADRSLGPLEQRLLDSRGAHEVLVARLMGARGELGILEVHDRQSRLRGFDAADVQLVETIASHLATALDNQRLLGRLEHAAYHDSLTGLRNRPGLRRAGTVPAGPAGAVVVVDLGLLESVNDALGHEWGDRIVREAGERLRAAAPDEMLLARLEGDTFALLLDGVGEQDALAAGERVRTLLAARYAEDGPALECDPVVGVALAGADGERDVDELLQHADVALQAARRGGSRVRLYADTMGEGADRRARLVQRFRGAMDDGEIDVHVQPKVALAEHRVTGVEVLVRWEHPELGTLDTEEFVSVIENTGLIDALTTFVLDRALAHCRRWLDRGERLSVAVNVSVRNLADATFPDRVRDALGRYGVPASHLVLELTESAVMSDPERALPVLRRLHALGLRIAVDDFGTGYSSLAYLRKLPVDEVKIDKSFVLGMESDLSDLAVVQAIVDLGHSLGLTVVAEGVEQDAARDKLRDMGCDVVQGYLVSRPLPPERFDAWLDARTKRERGVHDEPVLRLAP